MAYSFTQKDAALDEIADAITTQINKMNNAVTAFTEAKDALNALSTTYSDIISEIDTDATNNPSDEAILAQKARKDKYQADFIAQRTRATSLETAVSGI